MSSQVPLYSLETPSQYPVIGLVGGDGNPADLSGFIPEGSFSATVGRMTNDHYYVPEGTRSTAAMVASTEYAVPILVDTAGVTATSLGVEVATTAGTAGTIIRLGIRADDGNGFPGVVVTQTTVAGDAIATVESAVNAALSPGLYWLTATAQNTGATLPTVRSILGNRQPVAAPSLAQALGTTTTAGTFQSGITGALTDAWVKGSRTGSPPLVAVKVTVT